LKAIGIYVSSNSVCRLLKDMGFSLRVNCKKIESGMANPPAPKKRDQQFGHIGNLRELFVTRAFLPSALTPKKKN
jgi:hypothetical protein